MIFLLIAKTYIELLTRSLYTWKVSTTAILRWINSYWSGSPLFFQVKDEGTKPAMPWVHRLYRNFKIQNCIWHTWSIKLFYQILFYFMMILYASEWEWNQTVMVPMKLCNFIIAELLSYLKSFISTNTVCRC